MFDSFGQAIGSIGQNIGQTYKYIEQQAEDAYDYIGDTAQNIGQYAKQTTSDAADWGLQRWQGANQVYDSVGEAKQGAQKVVSGVKNFGKGMQKMVGGNWLPILGTVGLLAANGLGLGSVVNLGSTIGTQLVKLGFKGASWAVQKLLGASLNKQKKPNERNVKTSRVSLKHRRNRQMRQKRMKKKQLDGNKPKQSEIELEEVIQMEQEPKEQPSTLEQMDRLTYGME